jgi:hypothetical protein
LVFLGNILKFLEIIINILKSIVLLYFNMLYHDFSKILTLVDLSEYKYVAMYILTIVFIIISMFEGLKC